MKRARIVFFGSDEISLPLLQHLVEAQQEQAELVAVFTQPDRRTGRGMKLQANAIKQWAEARGIPVLQPEKPGPEEANWLREQQIDLALVMAYGHILKQAHLDAPRLGMLNFHASLLPRLRGASPIHTALATGEGETGVTLMRVIRKMDAGPALDQERVAITGEDTTGTLWDKLAAACVPLLERNLPTVLAGEARFTDQDEAQATYCRIIFKTDAHLDFTRPATELERRVRAFQPWPGTAFEHAGQEVKVGAVRLLDTTSSGTPGEISQTDGQLVVQCGVGRLELRELQRPGGKMLPADAFLRGFDLPSGTVLASREMDPLVAPRPFRYVDRRPVIA
ncbi:MAG: methionyl-tRNA formyltransferase [Verrucomicrobiota bacterium JB022]|nr:methionyl-tRNA formyltransferase [Verrucomicrobiota bacterium JB022]